MSVNNDNEILFKCNPNIFSILIIILYLNIVPPAILDMYNGFIRNDSNISYFVNISASILFTYLSSLFIISRYYFYNDKIIKIRFFKKQTIFLNNIKYIEIHKENISFNFADEPRKNGLICQFNKFILDTSFHTNVDKVNTYFSTYLPNYQELLVYEDE